VETLKLPPTLPLTTPHEWQRLEWRRRHVRKRFRPSGGWRQKPLWPAPEQTSAR